MVVIYESIRSLKDVTVTAIRSHVYQVAITANPCQIRDHENNETFSTTIVTAKQVISGIAHSALLYALILFSS
jgi:hypothetical protein